MKRKRRSRLVIMFVCMIIVFFIYNQFQRDTESDPDIPMPDGLHSVVKERTGQLVQMAADKGIVVIITDDFRSATEQDSLYEKGRTAGGSIVTYAKGGESYHNFGLAVDFALQTSEGDVIWDMEYDGNGNSMADWTEVVSMAKELGFEWGGDWAQFKDYPHLQMDFGLTISDLQRGEIPPERSLTADTAF
nr:M15 family metallopeptidase [uncultured Bacillus sp.]